MVPSLQQLLEISHSQENPPYSLLVLAKVAQLNMCLTLHAEAMKRASSFLCFFVGRIFTKITHEELKQEWQQCFQAYQQSIAFFLAFLGNGSWVISQQKKAPLSSSHSSPVSHSGSSSALLLSPRQPPPPSISHRQSHHLSPRSPGKLSESENFEVVPDSPQPGTLSPSQDGKPSPLHLSRSSLADLSPESSSSFTEIEKEEKEERKSGSFWQRVSKSFFPAKVSSSHKLKKATSSNVDSLLKESWDEAQQMAQQNTREVALPVKPVVRDAQNCSFASSETNGHSSAFCHLGHPSSRSRSLEVSLQVKGKKACSLFGVFTPQFGAQAADFLQGNLAKKVEEKLSQLGSSKEGIWNALFESFSELQESFLTAYANNPEAKNSGASATIVLIYEGAIWTAHLGKGLACFSGLNAVPYQLTGSTDPNLPHWQKEIEARDGTVVNGKVNGVLTSATGFGFADQPISQKPTITRVPLKQIPLVSHIVIGNNLNNSAKKIANWARDLEQNNLVQLAQAIASTSLSPHTSSCMLIRPNPISMRQ